MASRVPTFVRIYAEALRSIVARERGAGPDSPRRILLAHAFLLGDTLLLTGLVAKLRERHPREAGEEPAGQAEEYRQAREHHRGTERHEGAQCHRSIAQPAVSVVPVSLAADSLRQ